MFVLVLSGCAFLFYLTFLREIGIGRLGTYIYLNIKITCEKRFSFLFLSLYSLVCDLFLKFALAILFLSIKQVYLNLESETQRETFT